jgi:Spy/CpxP family protein refolding chaperone
MVPRTISIGLTALALALCAAAPALAQSQMDKMDKLKNTTPEERATAQTEMMKSKLSLTPEQTPKVAEINLKYAKEMDPIIKSSERPFRKAREMRDINGRKEAELKQVFTPEQFQKYQADKEEMRERFEKKMEKKSPAR